MSERRARYGGPVARPVPREFFEQAELFRFLRLWGRRFPDLAWVHSSLNGVPLPPAAAGKAAAAGMTSGVWDIFVPVPRPGTGMGGMYVEMKAGRGALTAEQKAFREALSSSFAFAVCHSWVEAAGAILDYLGIEDAEIRDPLYLNTKGKNG